MNRKIRWGVLGYARIARNEIIPAMFRCDNSEFHAIASRDQSNLDECRQAFHCDNAYTSYDLLLNDPNIEAIYIPLPNSMHKEWAIRAMEHGKHVLCEKPLCLNVKECEELIETSLKHKCILMEAFMYRYTDRIKKVQQLLDSNIIGDLKLIHSSFTFFLDRPNTIKIKPELGGGSLYDVGSYPVNFVSMILNELPTSCRAECIEEHGVDMLFSGTLRYDSGVIATVTSGFTAHREMYSRIVGTKGVIEIPDTFTGSAGHIKCTTGEGVKEVAVDESDHYQLELTNFANAVIGREHTVQSLDDSLMNARIIEQLFHCMK